VALVDVRSFPQPQTLGCLGSTRQRPDLSTVRPKTLLSHSNNYGCLPAKRNLHEFLVSTEYMTGGWGIEKLSPFASDRLLDSQSEEWEDVKFGAFRGLFAGPERDRQQIVC
jgi:hypothetical protein